MGDQNATTAAPTTTASKLSGWFKAVLGGVAGIMSGAFMMYFSPLLDKVVKPAKPVANFAVDVSGMSVTFYKQGGYMIKMAAVNGDKADEKSTIVYVDEPPPNALTAVITVTDQATRVEKVETPIPVTASYPPNHKESVFTFERQIPAKQG